MVGVRVAFGRAVISFSTAAMLQVYLLVGSPVSRSDLENAGVSTAKAVLVMKDPR